MVRDQGDFASRKLDRFAHFLLDISELSGIFKPRMTFARSVLSPPVRAMPVARTALFCSGVGRPNQGLGHVPHFDDRFGFIAKQVIDVCVRGF